MISAKLTKALEGKGFFLDFPPYASEEEIIIDILKQENPRLNLAIPLFLIEQLDYKNIFLELTSTQKKELKKILIISASIYKKENISSTLKTFIKENKINAGFSSQDFENYYQAFKESSNKLSEHKQNIIQKQSNLRLNLDLNKSLKILFSPAKIRILEKIFNHDRLTNTELKYYYKSISNINKAVLTPALEDYLRVIELSKKIH